MNPVLAGAAILLCSALATPGADLAAALRGLDSSVLSPEERAAHSLDLRRAAQAGIAEVNRRDREAWAALQSRADWEKFAAPRIEALRRSLGTFPSAPAKVPVHHARTVERRRRPDCV